MPYASDAQRRYFNANRDELESQGVDVDEWNQSSKGKDLPEKVKKSEHQHANRVYECGHKVSCRCAYPDKPTIKEAGVCPDCIEMEKKSMDFKKKANEGMQRYLNHLLQVEMDAPVHVKAARNEKLAQLSLALHNTNDLWSSLGKVYPEQNMEQRFKMAKQLSDGLTAYLRKQAMGAGFGTGMKMAPSGSQTVPMTAGMSIGSQM